MAWTGYQVGYANNKYRTTAAVALAAVALAAHPPTKLNDCYKRDETERGLFECCKTVPLKRISHAKLNERLLHTRV